MDARGDEASALLDDIEKAAAARKRCMSVLDELS